MASLLVDKLTCIDTDRIVAVISVSVSSLSLICEAFIIITYLKFNGLRPVLSWLHPSFGQFYDNYKTWTAIYCKNLRFTEKYPLYLHITIANALRDFAKIFGSSFSDNHYNLCAFQAFLVNFGGLSTFWWIATIGSVMYAAIFYPKVFRVSISDINVNHDWIYKREQIMIGINYGVPFLISLLPLFTSSYGKVSGIKSGTHCWLKDERDIDILWRWLCFYLHLIVVTVYCVIIYYLIGKEVSDKEFGALFQRIRWYPFCLLFGFGFSLIRRTVSVFIDFGFFGCFGQIIHAMSTGLFGVFIFVLVGRSRGAFQLIHMIDDDDEFKGSETKENKLSDGFRAAIFGLSDGLATNLCLILGIQFAIDSMQDVSVSNSQIITSGIAGLFGGAISMAIGEYVSVKAQSEATNAEIDKHRIRLKTNWNEQMILFNKKLSDLDILSPNTIDSIIEDLKKANHNKAECVLEFYAKLILGVDPTENNAAYKSAMYSFGMFAFGAFIPLSPYLWFGGSTACFMSIVTSLCISIIIGSAIAYFTHTKPKKAMQRQFLATIIGVTLSIVISKIFNS